MLRDSSVGCSGDWALQAKAATPSHQEIDRQLRRLAKQRARLDAEEARWLRRADDQNTWRALGYVHALEYLEEVFGYAPRTAQEKLRVAKALGELSRLESALEAGELPYSVVRELTRIATPDTEEAWLAQARGRNYRQVEQMLAGRRNGDKPSDDADPALIDHTVIWKLDASTRALLRETRRQIEDELGHAIDDATFVETLCRRAMEPITTAPTAAPAKAATPAATTAAVPRPRVTTHITTCRACKKTLQHGGGVSFELSTDEVERAACDAIIVDDEQGKRATSAIPPAMRRRIFERDAYKCRFPGCRSSRNLEIHHLEHRAAGGDHRSGNLGTLCGGHHKLHHDGVIDISGDADAELVFIRNGFVIREEDRASPSVATSRRSHALVERDTLAKEALQQCGFRSAVAVRAVERASALVARDAPLDVLLREAFRHCT